MVGTLAGCVLGMLFCWRIEEIRQFVRVADEDDAVGPDGLLPDEAAGGDRCARGRRIVLMALVLSVLATLYPSWRASRLDPVEALRYE